jgi:hypothetical protein
MEKSKRLPRMKMLKSHRNGWNWLRLRAQERSLRRVLKRS